MSKPTSLQPSFGKDLSVIKSALLKCWQRKRCLDFEKDKNTLRTIAANKRSTWTPGKKPRLFWGPVPILNNKYWSRAMKEGGYESTCIMDDFYGSINKRGDFDEYFEEIGSTDALLFRGPSRTLFAQFSELLSRFDVFHLPFTGCLLAQHDMLEFETELFRLADKKIVILPYGSDSYAYNRVGSLSLRNALLMSYPESGRNAAAICSRIDHYSKNADVIIPGFMCELFPFWNIMTCSPLVIDASEWREGRRQREGAAEATISIVHTPNHRGFKGTEFLVSACDRLRKEGYPINLILLEKRQNEEVRHIMTNKADILVEQLIFDGYALSGIEGMASGLPVLSNLSDQNLGKLLRRYAYLDECPIVSSTPETIYDNLKLLIERPDLRHELGLAGRRYVEKYHSFETAQYMFGKIYEQFNGEEVDLINLFHPILGEYPKQQPKVTHPLVNNMIVP